MTVLAALFSAILAATLLLEGGMGAANGEPTTRDAAVDAGAADGGGPGVGVPDGVRADGGTGEAKSPELPVAVPVGRLAGRVLAKGGPMAVPGASLVAGVAEIDTTDEHGDFSVDLPCGPTTLSILAAGFERLTTTIDACQEAPAPLTFRLLPAEGAVARETVVRATSPQPARSWSRRLARWAIRSG